MSGVSYHDRDYAFGQTILALRLKMGLTQAGLAQQLGISRRALSAWEAGSSHPKMELLKKLVALAIERDAFPRGEEVEKVRAIWQASHQKAPLDEVWLQALLTCNPKRTTRPAQAQEALMGGDKQTTRVLPSQPSTFVGRTTELAEIDGLLGDPACRLLTLVGPGGIGKTRLATQVVANSGEQFDDGVYFVPLQALQSPEFIVSSTADAIDLPFSAGVDPKQQLLQYLQEKALLLVLDNFENLLEGASLLSEILAAAPDIKLLVTSRQVLNLRDEWRYMVHGLRYPERDDMEQPGTYSAVQLFVDRARQVRGDLSLENERAAVVSVCRLVEGMPLALELAAGWAKALQTDEIATEIQRNLNFLSTSRGIVLERHQSIQVVFEQTWKRLSDEERRVFSALSVFRGGFRRDAAEAVAAVSLRVLAELMDKSLLAREPGGRYHIHELLRQYAEAQLEAMPEEAIRVRDLHAAYFARFLHEREHDVTGGRQRGACVEIEAELDNIRAAWSCSTEHSRFENIEKSVFPLLQFFQIEGRFVDGSDIFERAVRALDNGDSRTEVCLASVLCGLGWMCVRGGAMAKAQAMLERSWLLYSRHGVLPEPERGADPRPGLGLTYIRLGKFSEAETLVLPALGDHTLRQDRYNLAFSYYLLAGAARVQGRYAEARQYARQGYTNSMALGDQVFASHCLLEWGMASQLLGDMADAKQRLRACLAVREDFRELQGMGITLTRLGRVALLEGDNVEAIHCYERALSLYQNIGDKGGMATALEGMGNSACAMGHYGEARRYLSEALQNVTDRMLPRLPSVLVGIGELFLQTGQRARGTELLALALRHPVGDYDTNERARHLLTRFQTTSEVMQEPLTKADYEAVATALRYELQIPKYAKLTRHSPRGGETLIEPLSERELAVLTLVAEGLSNREIANQLFLSIATVKWYLTHIYGKLGVQNRTLAITRARELSLLP